MKRSSPKICELADRLIRDALNARWAELRPLLAACESPIEQILLAAMWDRWGCRAVPNRRAMEAPLRLAKGTARLVIEPQRDVATSSGLYRADFLAYLAPCSTWSASVRRNSIVVEADGHDAHERTRFQAARDKKRDRAMLLEGFRVVRFAGSEVYHHPADCVEEIEGLLVQRIPEEVA